MLCRAGSKRLSNRKEELKMTDALGNSLAEAGRGSGRKIWVALQELVRRPLESHERRRIDTVCQIPAYGPDGGLVPDTEANGMDAVVEIL